MEDKDFMLRAIELAKKGSGWTNPNPRVGAVIVKDNRIIGEGYHEKFGQLHAERNALAHLTETAKDSTLYVTLEPCCHYGKTPPCTEAIKENGIKKVVVGSRDPNPLVAGKGIKFLKDNGIEVIEDFLKDECDKLNPFFFKNINNKKPYVAIKYAMTLDGKIATRMGESKWITGKKAREHVHKLRGEYAAILAGIETVLSDDPLLNCRIEGGHQPLRIILDSSLRIPLDSQIVKTAKDYHTLVVCSTNLESEKAKQLIEKGVEVWSVPREDRKVDLIKLMDLLHEKNIDSVFIEGGATINEQALKSGIVDHVYSYIAPKIFGGKEALSPVEGLGVSIPSQAYMLENLETKLLDRDLLLEYDVLKD